MELLRFLSRRAGGLRCRNRRFGIRIGIRSDVRFAGRGSGRFFGFIPAGILDNESVFVFFRRRWRRFGVHVRDDEPCVVHFDFPGARRSGFFFRQSRRSGTVDDRKSVVVDQLARIERGIVVGRTHDERIVVVDLFFPFFAFGFRFRVVGLFGFVAEDAGRGR